jgi:NAD(P)-dependent dehydrogenase (short-subunit alcohol dehydrogenase family)
MIELKGSPFKTPNFDLSGKVAVVTGSSKGLGEGMAWALASYGAAVVISSRNQQESDAVAAKINAGGGKAIAIKADMQVKQEIDDLVSKTVEAFGRLDIMVSNAGTGVTQRVVRMTEEEWDKVLDTNLKGVFFCGAAAAKVMIEQKIPGRIINISSAGGLVGTKNIAAYCASKAGVISLSKTMAMEFGPYGITVNSLCPGYIPTSINAKPLEIPKVREQILNKTALKRLGEIEEIGPIVVFLASDASSIITGACIAADMGTTCN